MALGPLYSMPRLDEVTRLAAESYDLGGIVDCSLASRGFNDTYLLSTKKTDLADVDLLLLTDGHCLRDQVLAVCARPREAAGRRFADLRASSLETLLNMVAAGFGCTLLPALAVRGPALAGRGIIARPLTLATAARRSPSGTAAPFRNPG